MAALSVPAISSPSTVASHTMASPCPSAWLVAVAVNVTVDSGNGVGYVTGATFNVDDIVNDDRGQAYFKSNGSGTISETASGYPLFTFREGYREVTLINESTHNMRVNDVLMINREEVTVEEEVRIAVSSSGGFNFDAKVRRESVDLEDIFIGHIGAMDTFARALEVAHRLRESSAIGARKAQRYRSFDDGNGARFETGDLDLNALRDLAAENGEPEHRSGKQEWYENVVNQHL